MKLNNEVPAAYEYMLAQMDEIKALVPSRQNAVFTPSLERVVNDVYELHEPMRNYRMTKEDEVATATTVKTVVACTMQFSGNSKLMELLGNMLLRLSSCGLLALTQELVLLREENRKLRAKLEVMENATA